MLRTEDHQAVRYQVLSAAVLVHTIAHADLAGSYVVPMAIGSTTYEDRAAALRGTMLQPVEILSVDARHRESDSAAGGDFRRDRRSPGSERSDTRRLLESIV